LLSNEYAGRPPQLRVPATLVAESLRLKPVRDMFSGAPRESIRYLNHPVRFDTRRAEDILARHGLRCPRFPRVRQHDRRVLPRPRGRGRADARARVTAR
jgi:hypothetical protein